MFEFWARMYEFYLKEGYSAKEADNLAHDAATYYRWRWEEES